MQNIDDTRSTWHRIRGLLFMILNAISTSCFYILQKVLLHTSKERGNPIDPNEWMYWVTLLVLPLNFIAVYKMKVQLFPLPQNLRVTYLYRIFAGITSNIAFLFSLKFIPFSKASVIFWTSPVFTAISANILLKEKLT